MYFSFVSICSTVFLVHARPSLDLPVVDDAGGLALPLPFVHEHMEHAADGLDLLGTALEHDAVGLQALSLAERQDCLGRPSPAKPPCLKPSSISRAWLANTLLDSSRLYLPAIAGLTVSTIVEAMLPSFSNCSAQ